jgi:ferredoxin--NADP+ reductase
LTERGVPSTLRSIDKSVTYERVLSNVAIAENVRYLVVDVSLDFAAGQCVALDLDGIARYYSIASGVADEAVGILYDVVPGGQLTPRLASLSPGDVVGVSLPFGSFVDEGGSSVWIATGTGIAPFRSMIRSGRSATLLLHGSRNFSGMYFQEELFAALGPRYVPCVSRPGRDEAGALERAGAYIGRLTARLREKGTDRSARHYLCGSAAMVVDVRDLLVGLGVPFDNIESEIYF